jgi:8-oxo-dGTP diphosphatase
LAPQASDARPAALRVRVAAVILLDGRIVLVRHKRDCRTYHLLPGGGVETGESIADALRREVLEETGLEIDVERPLFVSDTLAPDGTRHLVNLTFLTRVTGGSLTDSPVDARVDVVEAVDVSALEGLDLRPPMAAELADAAAGGFEGVARYLGPLWTNED